MILRQRITIAERYYGGNPEYAPVVRSARWLFEKQEKLRAEEMLHALPTEQELLEELVEILKDKPVYKTLRRISKGTARNVYEEMKGLFSLGTHISIELEQGRREYGILLETVHRRLRHLLQEA